MNKLPIGKGIGERLRKTHQDEGRCRPDKITQDEHIYTAYLFEIIYHYASSDKLFQIDMQ